MSANVSMKFFSETSSHRPPSTFLTSYFGISICILQPCPAVIHKSLRFNLNAIQNQAHIQCDGFNIGGCVQIFNRGFRGFGKSIYRDLNQSRLDPIILRSDIRWLVRIICLEYISMTPPPTACCSFPDGRLLSSDAAIVICYMKDSAPQILISEALPAVPDFLSHFSAHYDGLPPNPPTQFIVCPYSALKKRVPAN